MPRAKAEPKVLSIRRGDFPPRAPTAGSGRSATRAGGEPGPIEKSLPAPLRALLAEIRDRAGRLVTPVNEYGYDPFGYDRDG
ncbi:MAG: hypothetical protein ACREQY_01055, partial [Candidatus Binatia bacterium]